MAILVRSFVDMSEVLKPLYAATALLGIHIMRPFQRLIIDVDTSYDTLLSAFPKLHAEFTEVDPNILLTSEQVFQFIPNKMFKEALPSENLLTNLILYSTEYKEDVVKILKICLSKFELGFHKQKGAIFGFGSSAGEDTGSILKISSLENKSVL